MTTFEWTVVLLVVVGTIIPFWITTIVVVYLTKEARRSPDRNRNVLRYTELMDYFHSTLGGANSSSLSGPSLVAALRELKYFPEQRDLSLLYLEEVTITGDSKFDDLAKRAIAEIEEEFLSPRKA